MSVIPFASEKHLEFDALLKFFAKWLTVVLKSIRTPHFFGGVAFRFSPGNLGTDQISWGKNEKQHHQKNGGFELT